MASDEPQELERAADIIRETGARVANEEFIMAPKGDIGKCIAGDLRITLDPLFGVLSVRDKIESGELGYTVLRVPGPESAAVHVKQGLWADLVPLRIISKKPSSSGRELLIGWKTHITGAIIIEPALDLLVITPLLKPV